MVPGRRCLVDAQLRQAGGQQTRPVGVSVKFEVPLSELGEQGDRRGQREHRCPGLSDTADD